MGFKNCRAQQRVGCGQNSSERVEGSKVEGRVLHGVIKQVDPK